MERRNSRRRNQVNLAFKERKKKRKRGQKVSYRSTQRGWTNTKKKKYLELPSRCDVGVRFLLSLFPWHFLDPALCATHVFSFGAPSYPLCTGWCSDLKASHPYSIFTFFYFLLDWHTIKEQKIDIQKEILSAHVAFQFSSSQLSRRLLGFLVRAPKRTSVRFR